MAYMHKTTFDILNGGLSDKNNGTMLHDSDDYFAIDEAIALPIQTLNRKGYLTSGCCSGHPFFSRGFINGGVQADARQETLVLMSGEGLSQIDREKAVEVFLQHSYCSINFRYGIALPSVPPGFTAQFHETTEPNVGTIRIQQITKLFNINSNALAFMREVIDTMEQLQQWALELPDNN